jgi:P2-related tail formation protein
MIFGYILRFQKKILKQNFFKQLLCKLKSTKKCSVKKAVFALFLKPASKKIGITFYGFNHNVLHLINSIVMVKKKF